MSNSNPNIIILRGVRLIYPQIYKGGEIIEDGVAKKTKKGSKLQLDPNNPVHAKGIADLRAMITAASQAKWGYVIQDHMTCLREGHPGKPWGAGFQIVSANTRDENVIVAMRPDKSLAPEEEGLFYSGAYANAKISLWLQDSTDYGQRVNANLEAVQFVRHGDPIGGGRLTQAEAMDGFDEMDDDDSDFMGG